MSVCCIHSQWSVLQDLWSQRLHSFLFQLDKWGREGSEPGSWLGLKMWSLVFCYCSFQGRTFRQSEWSSCTAPDPNSCHYFSWICVYKYTVFCTLSLCIPSRELASPCYVKLCKDSTLLLLPEISRSAASLCPPCSLPPAIITASLLSPWMVQESHLLCHCFWSWPHPLSLVSQTCKIWHWKQPLLPKRKEAIRLGVIPSCVRGAAAQVWASEHWVRGFREAWVLSLAPLDILAMVPGEVLRLKRYCFPGFSGPTFQGSWQLVLLFTAYFGVGSIYCTAVLCCICVR